MNTCPVPISPALFTFFFYYFFSFCPLHMTSTNRLQVKQWRFYHKTAFLEHLAVPQRFFKTLLCNETWGSTPVFSQIDWKKKKPQKQGACQRPVPSPVTAGTRRPLLPPAPPGPGRGPGPGQGPGQKPGPPLPASRLSRPSAPPERTRRRPGPGRGARAPPRRRPGKGKVGPGERDRVLRVPRSFD